MYSGQGHSPKRRTQRSLGGLGTASRQIEADLPCASAVMMISMVMVMMILMLIEGALKPDPHVVRMRCIQG